MLLNVMTHYEGKECVHGHGRVRYISNRQCVRCAKINSKAQDHKHRTSKRSHYPEPTRPRPAACECCGKPCSTGRNLCLDHDHETGEFRGWLCSNCNIGIGKLGDSLYGVRLAEAYLRNAQ